MDWSWLGLAGMTMVVIAWIPQTIEIIRSRRSALEWQFSALYFLGAFILTYYSILISDLVFTLLNSLAAYMAAIGLYFKVVEVMGAGGRMEIQARRRKRG